MRTIVGGGSNANNYPNLTGYVPKIYDVAGSYTYSVPANCSKIYAMVWGAGGSGAYNSSQVGTGGGGGGFSAGFISVSGGQTISLSVGAGGAPQTTNSSDGNAGGSTSFGNFISATGGSGGKSAGFQNTDGGAGGAGSIDDTTNVTSHVTANGGRGGQWIHDTSLGSYCLTGGGNSGSLLGDGGNGGDCMSGNGSGRMTSGGGGWAMGHAPTLVKYSTGDIDGGGGGPLNPGGVQHQFTSSALRGRGMGMLWKGSAGTGSTTSGTDVTTAAFSSSRTDPSNAGTSWWSVLTGASFGGTGPMNINGVPIGHGGTGGIQAQISGGMCGGNGGYNSSSWTYWGGYWIAGGGGNQLHSSLANLSSNGTNLTKKHLSSGNAAGAGGCNTQYGLHGGPGLVFVFPIIT